MPDLPTIPTVRFHTAVTVLGLSEQEFADVVRDVFDGDPMLGTWHPGRRLSVDSDSYEPELQPLVDWCRARRIGYLSEHTTTYAYPTPNPTPEV